MTVPDEVLLAEAVPSAGRSPRQQALHRLLRDRVAMLAALLLLAIVVAAVLAPWIAPADADTQAQHRLSLLLHGGRLSLLLGALPVLAACVVGTALGLVAGCCGGLLRGLVLRTTDVFCAFPSVLLAAAVAGVLGGGAVNLLIALTLVFTPQLVRQAERATTQVLQLDYVAAARLSGDSAWGIVRHHVLGSVLGAVLAHAAGLLGTSLILACGLSFLGLGVQPPDADWGLLLQTLRPGMPGPSLRAALPAVLIGITALAFNLLAQGLRSAMHRQR